MRASAAEPPTHRQLWLLASTLGSAMAINQISTHHYWSNPYIILILLIVPVVSGLSALLWNWYSGLMLYCGGRMFGGVASKEQIRLLLLLGSAPIAIMLAILGLVYFVAFNGAWEFTVLSLAYASFYLALMVWAVSLVLRSFGEAQGFSNLRALSVLVFSSVLGVAVMAVPAIMARLIFS